MWSTDPVLYWAEPAVKIPGHAIAGGFWAQKSKNGMKLNAVHPPSWARKRTLGFSPEAKSLVPEASEGGEKHQGPTIFYI